MSPHSFALAGVVTACLLIGCSTSQPAAPATSGSLAPAPPLQAITQGDRAQAALALYTLRLDPIADLAELQLEATRAAAQQDDVYLLGIDDFLRSDSLRLRGVSRTATTLDIQCVFTHPFAAPGNLDGPATAGNRADLGIAGQILLLADVPAATGHTFFGDETPIILNPRLAVNADGYYAPAGLIADPGTIATAFPYKLLVDERGDGNRVGQSNGGTPTGNFNPATGGWQRDNIGVSNDEWTGYGVLHQGQAAANTWSLNLSELTGPVTFRLAVVANYNDPRGGSTSAQKRANRLPKSPVDVFAFGYRMPHGALDVERIALEHLEGNFIANTISASTFHVRVTDWDARASETTESDLSLDPLVNNVAAGESGPPTIAVSLPGLLASTITFDNGTDLVDDDSALPDGDAGQDAGMPGDALYYTRVITKPAGAGETPGTRYGALRATDVEAGIDTSAWQFALAPGLTPTASPPRPEHFQAFAYELYSANAQPTVALSVLTPTVASGGATTVRATTYSDPESDPIEVRIDWNNDGDFLDAGETGNNLNGAGGPPVNFTSPITYIWGGSNPDTRFLPAQYTDNLSPPVTVTPTLTFTVIEAASGACIIPAPIRTDANLIGTFDWASRTAVDWASLSLGSSSGFIDVGAFQTPAFAGYAIHYYRAATAQYDFYRLASPGMTATQMTNFGGLLAGQQVHQIEVDSTNRVLFANKASLSTVGSPSSTYGAGNAQPNIRWFDYSGALVNAIGGTINTAGAAPIALALDALDNVYALDANHVLHRYLKSLGYTEDTTAPYPVNLGPVIGLNTGTGDTNRKVHDMVINYHNQAIYIFVQSQRSPGNSPPYNGYLYRIECDGSFSATTPAGAANPLELMANFSTGQGVPSDIAIDNRDASGNILPSASDVQMVTVGFSISGNLSPEVYHVNSDLQIQASLDLSPFSESTTKVAIDGINNRLFTIKYTATSAQAIHWGNPPTGWQ